MRVTIDKLIKLLIEWKQAVGGNMSVMACDLHSHDGLTTVDIESVDGDSYPVLMLGDSW